MALPKKGYKPGIYRFVSGTVDGNGDFSITNIPKDGYVSGIYQLTEVTIDADGNTSVAEDDIGITAAIEVTVDGSGDLSVTEVPEEGYVSGVYRVTTSTNIPKEGFNQIDFSAVIGTISGGKWESGPGIQFNAPLTNSLIPSPAVAATYTFARGDTDATVTDFEGLVKDVTANEARFVGARRVHNTISLRFDAGAAVTVDNGDGTRTTTGLTTSNANRAVIRSPVVAGDQMIFSISVKADIPANIGKRVIIRPTSGGTFAGSFIITLTDTFVRYIPNFLVGAGGFIDLWLQGVATNTASGVTWKEDQWEKTAGQAVTAPSEWVDEATDHGANENGVKYFTTENGNTVTSNVVTDALGAAIADATLEGGLVEEPRTNYCLYSEDLSNAAWVASNVTKSSDGVDLPSGQVGTAETLTASAGNGTLLQTITLASAVNTFSVYLQRKTGTGNIDITLDNGGTWTTKTLTGVGTWDRVDFTGSAAANPIVGIRIVTSADAVQMWGAQLATGAFLTSHMPTTSAAVTRNAESLSYPNTNILDDEGTLAITFTPDGSTAAYTGGGDRALVGVRGVNDDLLHIDTTTGKLILSDGTNETVPTTLPALVAGTATKIAIRWSAAAGTMQIRQDAVEVSATFDGSMNKSTALRIGYSGANRANGTYKNLIVYNGAVNDATFTGLTA